MGYKILHLLILAFVVVYIQAHHISDRKVSCELSNESTQIGRDSKNVQRSIPFMKEPLNCSKIITDLPPEDFINGAMENPSQFVDLIKGLIKMINIDELSKEDKELFCNIAVELIPLLEEIQTENPDLEEDIKDIKDFAANLKCDAERSAVGAARADSGVLDITEVLRCYFG